MEISDNFSLTRLFVTKQVYIFVDNKKFSINLKTVRDMFTDDRWNMFYNVITSKPNKLLKLQTEMSMLDLLKLIIFDIGKYEQFRELYTLIIEQFPKFIDNFKIDTKNKELTANGIIIDDNVLNHIIYLLKKSYGEKVNKPLLLLSEEAKQFYLAQQKLEEKISRIKKDAKSEEDSILKVFAIIMYSFPSYTIDYLFNQTMAQIQWLQQYAAGAMSYEVNAKAFAAGNMKKGSKLEPFIK